MYQLVNSDCLSAMKEMSDNSIDAIITDPPYGLSFMGAEWDSFGSKCGNETVNERREKSRKYAEENKGAPRYGNSQKHSPKTSEMQSFQQNMTPIFQEALRIAKPGAHLLCFGGTRTFHRMACAIEDAGWEIRDCIMWVYGSGFPKSMDISKAIDKKFGKQGEKVGERTFGKTSTGQASGWHNNNVAATGKQDVFAPATPEAEIWSGWGTCLKPAWEPIIVARKPIEKTIVDNVLQYGTGAINIDACRVPTNDNLNGRTGVFSCDGTSSQQYVQSEGRFPANLIHDGSDEVTDLFPDTGKSTGGGGVKTINISGRVWGSFNGHEYGETVGYQDEGSAARFFYCAKASKKDRGEGNDHPTVKPTALMQWLVRLVCPKGGTVLDPFMGSGSTGVACMKEGMDFVGVDMDAHYVEIARDRISKAESEPQNNQMTLFDED